MMGKNKSMRHFQIRNMISTPSVQVLTITVQAQIAAKFLLFCILNVEKKIYVIREKTGLKLN